MQKDPYIRIKKDLLKLTHQKDSNNIKLLLESYPQKIKGGIFEWYLAKLYGGNGWVTAIRGGRSDAGADILLYHPKSLSTVSLIVQAKNQKMPLSLDQTKIELIKFEEQAAPKYNCQQFNIVVVNGFVKDAEKLGEFNMLLYSWEYIAGLINRYDPENKTEPEIELYAHNKITYENCKELWLGSNYVAVVQATGTGKSYLIAKSMADHMDQKKLVMAPSNYILEQQMSKVPWASESTTFMTYARGSILSDEEIKDLDVNLIVLDEFHRCGAEVWGTGVQRILEAYSGAKVFGTTATPIRYLDANRDMSDELFDGVIAEDLPLAEAIIRKILPAPIYIAALYTLEEEIDEVMDILAKSKKSDAKKMEIAAEINRIKLDWEKTSGVPQILKKHLKPEINKFIIFCKDQEHLDLMEVEVQRWFHKAGSHRWRKVYRVLSADSESDKNLEDFKAAKSKDTAHLLFAIDMLNEGLHISDVGAVILLRPTLSPRIFYQQIGRCMQTNAENAPIIFDLVNNFQSIRANDFLENLQEAREAEQKRRADLGLGEYAPEISIIDETKDTLEVFQAISERLAFWKVKYQHLYDYADKKGTSRVPQDYITEEGVALGSWVTVQRYLYNKKQLSRDRIEALEVLPKWSWDPHEDDWKLGYEQLKNFAESKRHVNVPHGFKTKDGYLLGNWVERQRSDYKKNRVSEDRIKAFEAFPGWSWDPFKDVWETGYQELKKFVKRNGHSRVKRGFKTKDGHALGNWVRHQREFYRQNQLSNQQIMALEAIPGWIWNPHEAEWKLGYKKLNEYIERVGRARVAQSFKAEDGFGLGTWVSSQRGTYKKKQLSEDRIKALEALPGWSWDPYEDDWKLGYKKLKEYIDREGHARVAQSFKTEDGFGLGTWVSAQRNAYKKNKTSEDRIKALEALPGWCWDPLQDNWNFGYEQLKKYAERKGHARVPVSFKTEDGLTLGNWVGNQRRAFKNNWLSQDQIRLLEEIEFEWNTRKTNEKLSPWQIKKNEL